MRACREGGDRIEQALAELDRAYFSVLYRDCARAVNDSESARDLVQETFIKVWQRCATFRAASELLPWIKAILRRATIDFLRRRQRERRHEMPLDDFSLRPGNALRSFLVLGDGSHLTLGQIGSLDFSGI